MTTLVTIIAQRKNTTLDAVQQDISALEVRVHTPGADKLDHTANRIVLGMTIEETNFLEPGTVRMTCSRADVHDAKTAAIVGLVGESVNDVLVVVDGLDRGLVKAGIHGLLQRGDVKDVGCRVVVSSRADLIHLIKLVVKEQVSHPLLVCEPALVGVCGTYVGGFRDDDWSFLVGNVHDSKGILVIVEADLLLPVLKVGSSVDNALGFTRLSTT